jgi:hypothetical protein
MHIVPQIRLSCGGMIKSSGGTGFCFGILIDLTILHQLYGSTPALEEQNRMRYLVLKEFGYFVLFY